MTSADPLPVPKPSAIVRVMSVVPPSYWPPESISSRPLGDSVAWLCAVA